MTTTESRSAQIEADFGVYAPQQDTWMLCDAVAASSDVDGARVLDMCTGSGAVAIAAARAGAREVVAFDLSARAVDCARRNAAAAAVEVDVRIGSFEDALALPRFDVVLCNPPYVPSPDVPTGTGPGRAWDAGRDGRVVLDPLCVTTRRLLNPGGVVMIVHSDCADPTRTIEMLGENGVSAQIVGEQQHRFGPVMLSRAQWLESEGRIGAGADSECLVVVRGSLAT